MDHRGSERVDCIAKTVSDFIERSKTFVAEAEAADEGPDLLDGIHLRGVGRDVKDLDITRQLHNLFFVPHSAVTNKQDQIIRICLGQFFKKQVHTVSVTAR